MAIARPGRIRLISAAPPDPADTAAICREPSPGGEAA
jgi:hypothetical protein